MPIGRHAQGAVGTYLVRGRPRLVGQRTRGALFLNTRGGRISRQSCAKLLAAFLKGSVHLVLIVRPRLPVDRLAPDRFLIGLPATAPSLRP